MVMTMNLQGMPFEKFKSLMLDYGTWVKDADRAAFLYIEANRVNAEQAKEIIKILQDRFSISIGKLQELFNKCSYCPEVADAIVELNKTKIEEEKDWIVYYNHMDIGYRVKAKQYTEALLAAYIRYGADGKITRVEEA